MSDAAEVVGAALILFFGGGMLLMMNAALHGGNPAQISQIIVDLAVPVVVLAIIAGIAITLFQAAS